MLFSTKSAMSDLRYRTDAPNLIKAGPIFRNLILAIDPGASLRSFATSSVVRRSLSLDSS